MEWWQHTFLPILGGKNTQSFTIKYIVGCRFFIDILCQVEEVSFNLSLLRVFIMNGCFDFVKCLFLSLSVIYWDDHMVFIFQSSNSVKHFLNTEPTFHSWGKKTHLLIMLSFYILLDLICWYWLRNLAFILMSDSGLVFYHTVQNIRLFQQCNLFSCIQSATDITYFISIYIMNHRCRSV